MASPDLIYCSGRNRRFAEIAIRHGFLYGAQLPPRGLYYQIYFADQDWKRPDRAAYVTDVKRYKPELATVLDWEHQDQLSEVIEWAEDIAPFVSEIVIIPKVSNGISQIPRVIGGRRIRLGFSVPTSYGGTSLFTSEFYGWPVHLLGGSPKSQLMYSRYLDVVSTDGNYAQMKAVRFVEFFDGKKWVSMKSIGDTETDAVYRAFELSCKNIIEMWRKQNVAVR